MKFINNEKGITLLEVILSIAILSIIFLSFLSLFPQMGKMNNHNEDKSQAIRTAKEVLVKWQFDGDVKAYVANPGTAILIDPPIKQDGYYVFSSTEGEFAVKIKVKEVPAKVSQLYKAHLIIVELMNDKNQIVTETYGYMII